MTDIETRLRTSLQERAADVETTPALYERVQRQASRGAWLRRGLALAGAAAVVAAAVTVVPGLLPRQPDIDIAEDPEDALPSDDPPLDIDATLGGQLRAADVAWAEVDGSGTTTVTVGDRVVTSPTPVVSLVVSPRWTPEDGVAAAVAADGTILLVDQQGPRDSDEPDGRVPATPNGGGVAFSPDGQAVAWIVGTDLHVLPLGAAPDGERVLPLEGPVPDDLRIEQWFGQADAQVVLASDPDGDVWSIPMDDSNVFNSAPTDPAFVPTGLTGALDSALLDDLRRIDLVVGGDGRVVLSEDGGLRQVPTPLPTSGELELTALGDRIVLVDAGTGTGLVLDSVDGMLAGQPTTSWQAPGISAAAPLPTESEDVAAPDEELLDGGTDASTLGLPTGSPLVGTSGTDLLVRTSDGEVRTLEVYAQPESEAALGRVAVRPGSTLEDGLVALESVSEGEVSLRFVALADGTATPIAGATVTTGPITGLVWSEDGSHVAWTDAGGFLTVGEVSPAGRLVDGGQLLSDRATPVLDWVGEVAASSGPAGTLTLAVGGGTGTEAVGLARQPDGSLAPTGPVGGGDLLQLDTHLDLAGGVVVVAGVGGDTVQLGWNADDGTRDGVLPSPGPVGGDVRVEASGGQVLVMGAERQVLVTFDGVVSDLPTAADWDVLD